MFGKGHSEPYTIPFQGVYWILRRPDQPPPRTSLVMRASPTKRAFTSNDYRPLWMEAHDNLGTLIDVRCCTEVRVEVTDADARSKDVGIELLLGNTRERKESWSLGAVPLTQGLPDAVRPVHRTLTFLMPHHPRLDSFNTFTVRFPLAAGHSYRSARIAIERFVLVPRP
jgi:hypothetical protein